MSSNSHEGKPRLEQDKTVGYKYSVLAYGYVAKIDGCH